MSVVGRGDRRFEITCDGNGLEKLGIVNRYDRSRMPRSNSSMNNSKEVTEGLARVATLRESGFISGHFSLEELSRGIVFVLRHRYRIEAFFILAALQAGTCRQSSTYFVSDAIRLRKSFEHSCRNQLRLLKTSGFEEERA
jgi:hypothetical protein